MRFVVLAAIVSVAAFWVGQGAWVGTGEQILIVFGFTFALDLTTDKLVTLGKYSNSGNHADAVVLIAQAASALGLPLQRLIGMKALASYSAAPVPAGRVNEGRSSAEELMVAARLV